MACYAGCSPETLFLSAIELRYMLLAIDIGNTNIVLGLYEKRRLITHWRLRTQAEQTADEYGVTISQLIAA